VEHRPGHNFRYNIKGDKIKGLGFEHTIKFEEGLKETVEWYVKNESWWKPLIEKDAKILSEMPWKG
jgi:dTDP-glucose 4,6-dehydratase